MSPQAIGPARLFLAPAGSEIIGRSGDGTPVTAGRDVGVGPATEITSIITDIEVTR